MDIRRGTIRVRDRPFSIKSGEIDFGSVARVERLQRLRARQCNKLLDDVSNIVVVAARRFDQGVLHDAFTQRTVLQCSKQGVTGEVHHRYYPLALEATSFRSRSRGGNLCIGESF